MIQRGNNRGSVFFGPADYAHYRDWLGEAAAEYGCAIHAYVFMTDHVHLLVTPRGAGSLPGAMQSLGRRIAWAPLCPLCQNDLSAGRNPVGGTLSRRADLQRSRLQAPDR